MATEPESPATTNPATASTDVEERLKKRDHRHDDLVIAGPDGQIWQISQDALARNFQVNVDDGDEGDKHILALLEAGVTVAYMPPPPGATATGNAMCYLINLAGINTAKTKYQK